MSTLSATEPQVSHHSASQRFVLNVDGEVAGFASYLDQHGPSGMIRVFNHTVIDEHFQGRGLSKVLIQAALDDARAHKLQIVPECSAVAGFVAKHPKYRNLLVH